MMLAVAAALFMRSRTRKTAARAPNLKPLDSDPGDKLSDVA